MVNPTSLQCIVQSANLLVPGIAFRLHFLFFQWGGGFQGNVPVSALGEASNVGAGSPPGHRPPSDPDIWRTLLDGQ